MKIALKTLYTNCCGALFASIICLCCEDKEFKLMRRVIVIVVMAVALLVVLGTANRVLADNPPGTGQPTQSCEVQPTRPGNASSAHGSAFNPDGIAGTHYAGEQPQNSNNPKSVSQYDVACFQVSQH
jgi:hypothetical protein